MDKDSIIKQIKSGDINFEDIAEKFKSDKDIDE